MNFLVEYVDFYINGLFFNYVFDNYELIDVVDLQKVAKIGEIEPKVGNPQLRFAKDKPQLYDYFVAGSKYADFIVDGRPYLTYLLDRFFFISFLELNFFLKILFYINTVFFEFFGLTATTVTFWTLPAIFLFIAALILLFLIKPNELNMKIWLLSKYLIIIILIYQFCNILIYLHFFEQGVILKVGKSGAFNLPFNINLTKLFAIFLIIFSIFATILFYIECYPKTLLSIKPEFCSVLFFLGFGCSMVFFQNDLFSIFLYFEIISFCIYGLLFLHKWTNTQLHSLIRYVLFSLWVSTCYIVGIAFYLVSNWTTTSLFNFKENYSFNGLSAIPINWSFEQVDFDTYTLNYITNDEFSQILVQEFELLLAIVFILIYFLFKLGAGPFYTWTIEVYNSSSTGSLFVISMVPKLIYFPIMFFILFYNFIEYYIFWSSILFIIGLITTFVGSFGILISNKLKEIYAWSSIIHTGNLLLISSTISTSSLTFIMFYLVSYFLISFGFLILIMSLWNKITGRFIKTIAELAYVGNLNSNFYILTILLLASASGFTPFLSFFMKFSLLSLLSSYYGVIVTILVGLLNIIGSVAYLRMLRNIIGFNRNDYFLRSTDFSLSLIELKLSYNIGWLFNFVIILINLSFIFYKDFIFIFSFYEDPLYSIFFILPEFK